MLVRNAGLDLHLAEDGDPSAPPILLLHGITESARTWEWLVPTLAERFRVLRLDFRGHGRSDRAPGAYLADGYISDAVAALDQGAGQPCVVVGHSLGGVTAAALMQRHPQLLTGVVMEDPPLGPVAATGSMALEGSALLDGFRVMRESIPQLQGADVAPEVLAGLLAAAPDTTGRATFGDVLFSDGLEAMAASMLTVDAAVLDPVLEGTFDAFLDPAEPWTVPALLVMADPALPDAVATPEATDHYASISPQLEVVLLSGAGHLMHDELRSRAAFRDALVGFVDGLAPPVA